MRQFPVSVFTRLAGAAAALLLTAGAAAAELRIGVVNIAELLDEAPQAKSAMQHLQDEFAPRQREIVAQQQAMREKEETIQKDLAVMGETERRTAERELRDGQRELTRRQNEYLEDLNLRRNEELARLQKSLLEEVQAYARTAKFDLIVSDVLYASDAVDITSQVLKGLEERFEAGGPAKD
jgi:outer membrane protein